ncbi:MAG: hypothetical protein J7L88_01145, partial [Thermoplasmata archaeon]|nr:hypothetical protein [Thermoplasmata archaeon]
IIPDLVVTRLAINSESVWRSKIEQIKSYETEPVVTSDWGKKALLVGANTHNSGDGEKQSEYLWNKYLSEVYEQKVPLYEGKGLSRSAISANIEQGVVMINFVDHGGPTVWSDNYGAGVCYTNGDAASRRNLHMEPVVSTLACLTCWFDDPSGCQAQNFQDCIGEAFTENVNGGAIGYVGSSRTSVGVLGTNQYLPYDNGLQEDFARALTLKDVQGEVFTEAKRHYAASWGNLFNSQRDPEVTDTWLEYNFLGEPLVTLWKDTPKSMTVTINHTNSLNPIVQVWVKDAVTSQPLSDAVVTVEWASAGVWAQSTTDSNGYANLRFSIPYFGDVNITVRKSGYIPYNNFITIQDTLPPTTTLRLKNATLGENGWYLSQPWINLTTDEPARTFFRWDGGDDIPYTGDVVVPEGVHSFYYYSIDLYGNIEKEKQEILKVDLHNPVVNLTLTPKAPDGEGGWYISNVVVTLTLNTSVPQASPETIFYRVDGGPIKRYYSPITLGDGEHVLEYWAEEESGRTSPHKSVEIPVDTIAPTTLFSIDPALPDGENRYYVTSPTVVLTSRDAERIYYRSSPDENFTEYRGPIVLEDGHHIFQYYSIDAAGNRESVKEEEISVDTRPPTIDVSIDPKRPDGRAGWYITKPTLRFTSEDISPTTIYYRIDRGPIKSVKGPVTIDDGEHSIMIYAKDEAGNKVELPTLRIKVDTEPPEVFCTVRGVNNNGVYSRIYAIELYAQNSQDTVYYRWEEGFELEYTGSIKPPGNEGIYTLYYWGEDPAGNRCPTLSKVIYYDTEPPRGKVELKGEKGEVTLDLSGITDGMSIKEYEIDFGDGTTVKLPGERNTVTHTY